ncbi:hypothetical protein HYH02_010239 [Chlamydomonas schloesseri]|uniref:Serine protease n=1 Tax=Chlamydomonas schloesseri TaxID=2026947 RepID=A0A835TMX2_9CHLO|nr:hypothetical protein HYH02_010239 [Chlamydomonas schloesseri]|eukprot:KAG2440660.1 hypothetical protein HYH02_010239 [Chlamydomonas schloesseri]
MITKADAAAAIRATTGPGKERARLLGFVDQLADDQLREWLIQAEDGHETIVEFIKDRAAGPAGGTLATATAGRAESSDRATVVARYSVTDKNFRSVFTPLRPRVLVTHRHGSHASWKPGTRVKVLVNDVNADKPRQVECKVLGCHDQDDVVFCITDEELDAPDLDLGVAPGARYLLLGCSNRSQDKPYSVCHGVISTTVPDSNGHVRGDTPSVPGDSGAGCFSEETGKLFAINVGRDHKNGDRAVLVPVASLLALLRTHAEAPARMRDWGPGE